MNQSIRVYQIENLLLTAHLERERGVDLIEECFSEGASLDEVTKTADTLLKQKTDNRVQKAILKNLSECIVVKIQRDRESLFGSFKQCIEKLGFHFKKCSQVQRAERLIQEKGTSTTK